MKPDIFDVSLKRLLAGAAVASMLAIPLASHGEGPAVSPQPAAPGGSALAAYLVQTGSIHSHPMDVTWHSLDTLEQVNSASALVVRAKVLNQRRGMMRTYGWNPEKGRHKTPQEAGNEYTDTPLTISTLSVLEVVRGSDRALAVGGRPLAEGGIIELVELGGYQPDGCFAEPGDKPVLHASEEGVFFLSPAERPGAYNVVGGWQGRMSVRQGAIHALASDTHPGASQFTRYTGRDVKAFIDEVRRMPVQP